MPRTAQVGLVTVALALSSAACGNADGESDTVDFGSVGVSEGFAWAGYYRFEVPPLGIPVPACVDSVELGNCRIPHECPADPRTPPEANSGNQNAVDPGPITVGEFPLARDPEDAFSATLVPPLPLGEPIVLSVQGSRDVPAHSTELILPPAISVLTPDLSSSILIDRTRAFSMTWTPVDIGDVLVGIIDPNDHVAVSCWAPGNAGKLEVPVEVLAFLHETPATGVPAQLTVEQSSVTQLHPKDWSVRVTAQGRGQTVDATVQ